MDIFGVHSPYTTSHSGQVLQSAFHILTEFANKIRWPKNVYGVYWLTQILFFLEILAFFLAQIQ